jgi:hypothetical protein
MGIGNRDKGDVMRTVNIRILIFVFIGLVVLGIGAVVLFSQQSPKILPVQLTEYDLQNAREIAAVKADIDSSKTILKGIGLLLISLNGIGAGVLAHVYKAWDRAVATETTFRNAVEEFDKLQKLVSTFDCVVNRRMRMEESEP